MNPWQEIGLGQVPGEIVRVGLGAAPLTDGRYWYMKHGGRVLRAGMGALSDVSDQAQALLDYLNTNGVKQGTNGGVCSTFQSAWNAAGGSPPLAQVDDEYGPCTQNALQAVLDAVGAASGSGGATGTRQAPQNAYPGACSNGSYVAPPGPGGGGSGGATTIQPAPSPAPSTVNTTGMLVGGAVGGAGGGLLGYFVSHAFHGPRMHVRLYTGVGALVGAGIGGYFGAKA